MEKDHVFIGDVHGDNNALLDSIAAYRLIAPKKRWSKSSKLHRQKDAKLVLMGDLVDRGTQNMQVLETVEAIREEWKDDLIVLLGNHDLMWRNALESQQSQYPLTEWMMNDGDLFLSEFARLRRIPSLNRVTGDYPFDISRIQEKHKVNVRQKWRLRLNEGGGLEHVNFPAALDAMRKYYLESSAYNSLWEQTVLAYQPCPEVIAVHASVEADHTRLPNRVEMQGGQFVPVESAVYQQRLQSWASESIAAMGVEVANNVFALSKHSLSLLLQSSCVYGAIWNRHFSTKNMSSPSIDYLQQKGVQLLLHGHTPNFNESVRFNTYPSGIHLLCVDNAMSAAFHNSETKWSYALLTKDGELSMHTNRIPQTILGDLEGGKFHAADIDGTDVKG